jgi:hypothetical protein
MERTNQVNDDDAMSAGIIVVAVVIIIWCCVGCSTPAKVDGDERPPEQVANEPVKPPRMPASTPEQDAEAWLRANPSVTIVWDVADQTDPSPYRRVDLPVPEVQPNLMMATAPAPSGATNITKRGRLIKPRSMSDADFAAWKKARGF